MIETVSAEPAPVRAPWRGWLWVRMALVALAVVTVVGALGWGERPATLGELQAAVSAGRVGSVQVAGTLPPGATGEVSQQVRWRDGWQRHRTDVRWVSGASGSATVAPDADGTVPAVVRRDVGDEVRALDPTVRVNRVGYGAGTYGEGTVLGASVPGWVALLALGQGLLALFVLVNGPQPWLATRWAWFWLLTVPFGVTAFALLSGPLRGHRVDARVGRRRLHGGWAFLLSCVLGTVLGGAGLL